MYQQLQSHGHTDAFASMGRLTYREVRLGLVINTCIGSGPGRHNLRHRPHHTMAWDLQEGGGLYLKARIFECLASDCNGDRVTI